MRLWPFNRKVATEDRASYTDALVSAIVAASSGNAKTSYKTLGVAQVAAGLWGRTLASAAITPEGAATASLTSKVLFDIGVALVMDGEDVYEIVVDRRGVTLVRSCSWDVFGSSSDPNAWRYRLDIPTPNGTITRIVPGASVFHPRILTNSAEPHRGQSPIAVGSTTARLAAALENQLADESEAPSGKVLPAPLDSINAERLTELKTDLRNLKGRTSLVQSMATAWGEGRSAAPSDWKPQRLGADPPETLQGLRRDSGNTVLAACGVPESLYSEGGDTSGRREAFRQFLHSTIAPVGQIVAEEVSMKLQPGAEFSFERLFASDIQGRARAFQSLVGGGMEIAQAAAVTGILGAD